jgi:hypothetical protein
MELVDRYLDAVKRHLPKAQQDDIVAELADDIESQLESKEVELGRPLNLDEQSDVLKAYARPIVVAARYRPQQYLIGPGLFPYYVNTLKTALVVVLALWFAGATVEAIVGSDHVSAYLPTLSLFNTLLWVIGVVTVIFTVRERVPAGWPARWDPRRLPRVRQARLVSRTTLVWELIWNLAFVSWLLDVPGVRHAAWYGMVGPASTATIPFALTPAWRPFIVALLLMAILMIAVDSINLVRPEWTRLRAAMLVIANASIAIVLGFVLQSHALIVPADDVKHIARYQEAAASLNSIAYGTLVAWAVISALVALSSLRPLLRRGNGAPLASRSVALF